MFADWDFSHYSRQQGHEYPLCMVFQVVNVYLPAHDLISQGLLTVSCLILSTAGRDSQYRCVLNQSHSIDIINLAYQGIEILTISRLFLSGEKTHIWFP